MTLWTFLAQIVMLLGGAFVLGAVAQRLRQSPIIGYLLAGTIIGPLLFNPEAINQTAELGVSLLLFSIGLEFSFGRLKSMGRMAFGGGTIQVVATLALTALALTAFAGLSQAIVIGAMAALSSTAVVMRVLVDRAEIDSVRGRSCLAILLLQDVAIVPLVITVSLMTPSTADISIGLHIAKIAAAAVGLAVVLYLLLYWLAPALLSTPGVFANRELSVLLAISVGIGATLAAHALHISPALGAFVAGMLLGESPFAAQIQSDIGSLRIVMVTLFFASVGMLAKPLFFLTHAHWVMAAAGAIFVAKSLMVFLVTRLFGLDNRHALATGISLAQVGEFAFVLAASADQGKLFSAETFDLMISTTIILMFAAPYMVSQAFPLADKILRHPAKLDETPASANQEANTVLVVGFGPAGRQVVQHLQEHKLELSVLDVNPLSRKDAQQSGLTFHLGDAANEDILIHAGLPKSCMAVVTIPDPPTAERIVAAVRRLRPHLPIAVRCRYNRHYQRLVQAGADIIVDEETRIGHLLANEIIRFMRDTSGQNLACRLAGRMQGPGGESEQLSEDRH
ncbi:MAG: hypothetical protein HKP58_15970 [Desulfatitalea sp.]|nr:cation:proton antiporter [Desulfatitalea sp.]NNK01909.1 hypothetical protein [Desulfatitalea sp.]